MPAAYGLGTQYLLWNSIGRKESCDNTQLQGKLGNVVQLHTRKKERVHLWESSIGVAPMDLQAGDKPVGCLSLHSEVIMILSFLVAFPILVGECKNKI